MDDLQRACLRARAEAAEAREKKLREALAIADTIVDVSRHSPDPDVPGTMIDEYDNAVAAARAALAAKKKKE